MPKRANHIWDDVVTFENLLRAWRKARRGKGNSPAVLAFARDLEENLFTLQESLAGLTWSPGPFRAFVRHDPNGKMRNIQAPAFSDRVVHHALMNQVEAVFERRFIADSYACRKSLGTHAASRRTTQFLIAARKAWGTPYILKGDVSKYFSSIDHEMLLARLRRMFADRNVLWLFERIIRGYGENGRGLPIGALTSQWLANVYLDPMDHLIKDDMGVKFYVRYMDDFVLIGPSKAWCWACLENIQKFLALAGLDLNPKTGVWPASHGVDFVGYRHFVTHTLPRKRTVKRARHLFKSLVRRYALGRIDVEYVRPRVVSFTGYMKHCNGVATLRHILDNFALKRPAG